MATRAYIVDITDENTAEMIYNHFDGGEHLNKVLNRYKIDPDDIFSIGGIKSIDQGGNIERYKDGGPISINGNDLLDTLNKIVEKSNETGVDYLQVLNSDSNEWVTIKRNKRTLVNLLDVYKYLKRLDMNENYESKWKRFINEDQRTLDYKKIINDAAKALKGNPQSNIEKYLESLKNEFGVDNDSTFTKYNLFTDQMFIDDFDNYIFGDLDN